MILEHNEISCNQCNGKGGNHDDDCPNKIKPYGS